MGCKMNKLGRDGKFLSLIKAPLKTHKTRRSALLTSIQDQVLEIPARTIRQDSEIQCIYIEKAEAKKPVFTGNMTCMKILRNPLKTIRTHQ